MFLAKTRRQPTRNTKVPLVLRSAGAQGNLSLDFRQACPHGKDHHNCQLTRPIPLTIRWLIHSRRIQKVSAMNLLRVTTTRLAFLAMLFNLSLAELPAADTKGTPEERMAKVRTDLKNADAAVRQAAIGSLVHSDISPKLLDEMRAALTDGDGTVRSTAATAIGNLGADAVTAISQLAGQLKADPVKEARETAARALGRIGKAAPKSREQLLPALQTASREDKDPVTRVVALGALAMIDQELPEQVKNLRKYLHHEDALVRMKSSHALGMIGLPAKEAAPEIVDVLKRETDHHRRGYVARALGSTGDPASLPALEEALKAETDAGAQGEMRGAISRLKAISAEKTKS